MGTLVHVLSALLTLPPTGDPIRVEPPPTAEIVDADGYEQTQARDLRVRWASVTYVLAAGPEAEVFVEVDERGRGDGYLAVDGELLAHVVYDAQVLAVWVAEDVDLDEAVLRELMQAGVGERLLDVLASMEPQETNAASSGGAS